MKTKLGLMAACAAVALATEPGNAQNVVWVGGNAFYAGFSLGSPCPPQVVTYVPVVGTVPVVAWGMGIRTIIVPSCQPRVFHHSPPPVYHRPRAAYWGGRGRYVAPPVAPCRPTHGQREPYPSRGASSPNGHRR